MISTGGSTVEIRCPRASEIGELHRAFSEAFSDYSVPLELPLSAFQSLLSSRGISWNHSRIAVREGRIVGFWLIGTERDDSTGRTEPAAYDIATGVVPAARRSGLARRLYHEIENSLVGSGAAGCTLEVVEGNLGAVQLYRRLGFATRRRLLCYRFPEGIQPTGAPTGVTLLGSVAPAWEHWRGFWDWSPSWPSGIGGVERAGREVTTIVAEVGGRTVGYAVAMTASRNVAQLAVDRDHRRRGVGRALLSAVVGAGEESRGIRFLNVPDEALPTRDLIESVGGEVFVSQLEMGIEFRQASRRESESTK